MGYIPFVVPRKKEENVEYFSLSQPLHQKVVSISLGTAFAGAAIGGYIGHKTEKEPFGRSIAGTIIGFLSGYALGAFITYKKYGKQMDEERAIWDKNHIKL